MMIGVSGSMGDSSLVVSAGSLERFTPIPGTGAGRYNGAGARVAKSPRIDSRMSRPLTQFDAHALPTFEAIDVGYQGLDGAANSYLLRTTDGPILVETGPQVCRPALERGLRARSIEPDAITRIFVTHIHLDHA